MAEHNRPHPSFFSQIDVSHGAPTPTAHSGAAMFAEMAGLLRAMLAAQDRQNELLEELVNQMGAAQRQRAAELGQWKQANPGLARSCRMAAESLSKIQTEYLETLTSEIGENFETLRDGEFMLNEFVDRFGPRVAHLNGLLQVLSQLSATPDSSHVR
ncbi:MAG: hypothetical protein ACYC6Y_26805 [Thermoguttaceae bacterium]